ncbi:MAG: hypothetical protein ACI4NG_02370 [Candidatus Gallimonas sp.]
MAINQRKFNPVLLVSALSLAFSVGCSSSPQTDGRTQSPDYVYSDTFRLVLYEEPYVTLVKNYRGNADSADFRSFPYAFCESQGFDVEAIRSGETESGCVVWTGEEQSALRFTLYLRDGDGEEEEDAYYVYYQLSYPLTAQEMTEWRTLNEGNYIEAPLFAQAIAQTKTVSVLSESYLGKEAFDSLFEALGRQGALSRYDDENALLSLDTYDPEKNVIETSLFSSDGRTRKTVVFTAAELETQDFFRTRTKIGEAVWEDRRETRLVTALSDSRQLRFEETESEHVVVYPLSFVRFDNRFVV